MSRRLTVRTADAAALQVLMPAGQHVGEDAKVLIVDGDREPLCVAVVSDRPFESSILGVKTAHIISLASRSSDLDGAQVAAILDDLSEGGYRLVTARHPESEQATTAALQSAGFDVIERLVTLSRTLATDEGAMPDGISRAQRSDADSCAELARCAFHSDRFHADPNLNDAAADRLKAEWARNSICGRADQVFLTHNGHELTGFNACLVKGDVAAIDLIGVSAPHRGRGLGRTLVQAALSHYAGKAVRMTVGTQATNAASLSLYHSAGFRPVSTAVTLHAHLT